VTGFLIWFDKPARRSVATDNSSAATILSALYNTLTWPMQTFETDMVERRLRAASETRERRESEASDAHMRAAETSELNKLIADADEVHNLIADAKKSRGMSPRSPKKV